MPTKQPSRSDSEQKKQGSSSDSSEDRDLEEREYRDENGEVHHHTKKYMEEHQGETKEGR